MKDGGEKLGIETVLVREVDEQRRAERHLRGGEKHGFKVVVGDVRIRRRNEAQDRGRHDCRHEPEGTPTMGSVFRKTYTAPLPPDAELFDKPRRPTAEEREADPDLRQVVEKFARWRDKNGKAKTARVTNGRDGEPRLLVEAGTFVAKFRDGEGIVRTVATGAKTETGARVILADLERQAEKVRSRLLTPAESKAANHSRRPISEHLADYRCGPTLRRNSGNGSPTGPPLASKPPRSRPP